jgi:hypothetical protein
VGKCYEVGRGAEPALLPTTQFACRLNSRRFKDVCSTILCFTSPPPTSQGSSHLIGQPLELSSSHGGQKRSTADIQWWARGGEMGGGAVPVAHSKVNIDPSTRLRKASKCRNGSVAVEPSAVEHTPRSCRPEFRSRNPASLENSSSPFGHTLHAATYPLTSSDLIIDFIH